MTENQLEFFQLLQKMQHKVLYFSYQLGQNENLQENFSNINNYFEALENEVSDELSEISKKFSISNRATFVLGSIIHMYLKFDGIKTNFITFSNIARYFYLDFDVDLYKELREGIFELEEKNIIEIIDAKFYLVRVLYSSDQPDNEYYMLPAKPSFVPFANKNFELSNSTVSILNNL